MINFVNIRIRIKSSRSMDEGVRGCLVGLQRPGLYSQLYCRLCIQSNIFLILTRANHNFNDIIHSSILVMKVSLQRSLHWLQCDSFPFFSSSSLWLSGAGCFPPVTAVSFYTRKFFPHGFVIIHCESQAGQLVHIWSFQGDMQHILLYCRSPCFEQKRRKLRDNEDILLVIDNLSRSLDSSLLVQLYFEQTQHTVLVGSDVFVGVSP